MATTEQATFDAIDDDERSVEDSADVPERKSEAELERLWLEMNVGGGGS